MGKQWSRGGGRKGPRWNNGLVRRAPRPRRFQQQASSFVNIGDDNPQSTLFQTNNPFLSTVPQAEPLIARDDLSYGMNGDSDINQGALNLQAKYESIEMRALLDAQMGFLSYEVGHAKVGWMVNMQTTLVKDLEWPSGRSAVDFYFIEDDNPKSRAYNEKDPAFVDGPRYFKATVKYSPYFYLKCKVGTEADVEELLIKSFGKTIESICKVEKEDLDTPNHLSGLKRTYLKLTFRNTSDLNSVKRAISPVCAKNAKHHNEYAIDLSDLLQDYNEILQGIEGRHAIVQQTLNATRAKQKMDTGALMGCLLELREHDLPYHLRVCIDLGLRVGLWYEVQAGGGNVKIVPIPGRHVRPDPVVLAFDIETCKAPLKFPDPAIDQIMMISYMIDGRGYLITNRQIVSQDIDPFDYRPKADIQGGHFDIFNEVDERALIERFLNHVLECRPAVFVSYNGDSFDWPFIEARAAHHSLSLKELIGVEKMTGAECGAGNDAQYQASYASHMDCYKWVKRDSYLPAGSQGLKSVCSIKLGYDPVELDPEQMVSMARENPIRLAQYSVSDAVATYFLYMKYVHPFIFSLCTIIPLQPDEVLRKGSGTLCETLLMAQAYQAKVVMPNKHQGPKEAFYEGHLLHAETYIGGHVECLESGVFRSDLEYPFKIKAEAVDQLLTDLDRALTFCLKCEGVLDISLVTNYQTIRKDIETRLIDLRNTSLRTCNPLIYHLDVAAMYPNIILTNRLQPAAMIDESTCAVCDYNRPGKRCQRKMQWSWRGEFYTAKMNEYRQLMAALEKERFPVKGGGGFGATPNSSKKSITRKLTKAFHELPLNTQHALIQKRLTKYSQKVYKRVRSHAVVQKESIVCQREHPFYIDTVRQFRDRRYEFKDLLKKAKKTHEDGQKQGNQAKAEEGSKLCVLYDSLQLAHKCILNSFYGYVMRKGARWYSMEMAGIVCQTGAEIITLARQLVEQLGRPLELDTDGIWCMLPSTFPQNYVFETVSGKRVPFAYPCVMLNHLVHDKFTNDQYHNKSTGPDGQEFWSITSENSIFFEIDGPYKAMILPSSTEENKQLKKRYAVFAEDGHLAELKGFEVKRRGELRMVKVFQTELFKTYLLGNTLKGCYAEVARVADKWLDILYTQGASLSDQELFDLISENRSMSRTLEDYGDQKSTSISTARRLAEFLGQEMVKDAGLACRFIISAKPVGDPVASRAIPVAIFSAPSAVKTQFLRKWLRDPHVAVDCDPRSILDWPYYLERIGSMIQKLIVIPAAMQGLPNPVPRVSLPDWLQRKVQAASGKFHQSTITFKKAQEEQLKQEKQGEEEENEAHPVTMDLEDTVTKQLFGAFQTKKKHSSKKKGESIGTPSVDMNLDYSIWVQHQRNRWRLSRASLKHKALVCESVPGVSGNLLASDPVLHKPWQIVHVQSTKTPGLFTMWLVVDGKMRIAKLSIPRRIYVHAFTDIIRGDDTLQAILKPVEDVWRLPLPYRMPSTAISSNRGSSSIPLASSSKTIKLYELVADEPTFAQHAHLLSTAFSHPHIEQVYEADIDPMFTVVRTLGCITCVSPKHLDEIVSSPECYLEGDCLRLSLDQLSGFKSIAYQAYLEDEDQRMAYLYLDTNFVAVSSKSGSKNISTGARGLVVAQLSTQRQTFPLKVISFGTSDQFNQSMVKRLVQEVKSEVPAVNGSGLFGTWSTSDLDTSSLNLSSADEVLPNLLDYLMKCSRRVRSRFVTIGLCHGDPGWITDHLDTALGEMPLLMMASSNIPSLAAKSVIEWGKQSLSLSLERLTNLSKELPGLIELARYSHVPLGALIKGTRFLSSINNPLTVSIDHALTLISDVFLARQLRSKGYLLPPLASRLGPNSLHSMNDESLLSNNFLASDGPMERSGSHTTICMDLSVTGMSVNAMITADRKQHSIPMISGETQASIQQRQQFATMAPLQPHDALWDGCRTLIRKWSKDSGNQASLLLNHFYRWVRSDPDSPHDSTSLGMFFEAHPIYYRLRQGILRSRDALVEKLQLMGALVIYANSDRLVIRTTKQDRWSAMAYWSYLNRQLNQLSEFSNLVFEIRAVWRCLCWLDSANFGGFQYSDEESKENLQIDDGSLVNQQHVRKEGEIAFRWAVADHLPPLLQQPLKQLLLHYLVNFYQCSLAEEKGKNLKIFANSNNPAQPPSANDFYYEEADQMDPQSESTRAFLPFDLSQRCLVVVKEVQRVWSSNASSSEQQIRHQLNRTFPVLPGTHLDLTTLDGPLEFVKVLCAILSIHAPSRHHVFSLQKQAIALLSTGISEFSDRAQFVHPCLSLRINDVLCPQCPFTRDLDFGKDLDLQPQSLDSKIASIHCQSCSAPLDMTSIEAQLCAKLHHLVAVYQTQDLQCPACKHFPSQQLIERCPRCAQWLDLAAHDVSKPSGQHHYSSAVSLSMQQRWKTLVSMFGRVGYLFDMKVLSQQCTALQD